MRALVVFYSLSGTTRKVAQAVAVQLGADLEEISCPSYRRGFFGFWRAGHASWKGKIPEIGASAHAPSDYDLVVVGGPVWAWNVCTPVRAYLMREAARLPAVAYFVTVGGVGFEQALATMAELAGRKPVATLVLRTEDFKQGRDQAAIASFAAALGCSKAA
ncbi:MAG TPA: flavodoxin [Stellaceae bacterium]|nr:flavodoxin [Stellaceae bacterium]